MKVYKNFDEIRKKLENYGENITKIKKKLISFKYC